MGAHNYVNFHENCMLLFVEYFSFSFPAAHGSFKTKLS